MMKWLTVVAFFVVGTASALAQSPADPDKEKAELLRVHRADREAHFKTDVDLLQAHSPEVFVAVSRGKIHRPTRAGERKQFTEYFRGARYFEWDDLEEPIVRVSKDGSMAWMITRIKVRRVQKDSSGKEHEEKFVYAGIMTYEKLGGKWVRVANVSTFEPPN
ncbi:MAG TPA: hypothetical protein VF611_15115 [Pyrinomonadaceae bacterium]